MKTGLALAAFWTFVIGIIAAQQWSNPTTNGSGLQGWTAPAWILGSLVLLAAGAVWDHSSSRPCPRCGHRVRNGTMRCDSCHFDFETVGR